ncbi:hypothetical protein [Maribacter litoralis]|uniref:hypothetical protein n=1 Tax=Maribacter litoralis TaxID=2059726 RepID=UPI003D2BAEA4
MAIEQGDYKSAEWLLIKKTVNTLGPIYKLDKEGLINALNEIIGYKILINKFIQNLNVFAYNHIKTLSLLKNNIILG